MFIPRHQHYRFPAEWEPHRATWLSYPYQEASFPGRMEKVLPVFAEFVAVLSRSEEVCMNVPDAAHEEKARGEFALAGADLKKVSFFHHRTDDVWCRDHGGIFLIGDHGQRAILNWKFNAWGGKYPFDNDQQIATKMAEARAIPLVSPGIVLEGGAIEHNGNGTLLTTEACLLNPNRNPQLSQPQIELYLKDFLNVEQVLWLKDGIAGDDTDGHVDDLCRFVDTQTVLTVVEESPEDENYQPLQENLDLLRSFRLPGGQPLEVVILPMPDPLYADGERLPASYANFYIANRYVIVPTFACPQDEQALSTIGAYFPDREVVGIDSRELVAGFGSFHCLSQQEPA